MINKVDIRIAPIPNWPGYYADTDGGIWSRRNSNGRIGGELRLLSQRTHEFGHKSVHLSVNHIDERVLVHRLILETFKGPCPDGMECRHFDGNPANNHIDNLLWGTRQEQHADRRRHGTDNRGSGNSNARLTELEVIQIRLDYEAGVRPKDLIIKYKRPRYLIESVIYKRSWNNVLV